MLMRHSNNSLLEIFCEIIISSKIIVISIIEPDNNGING